MREKKALQNLYVFVQVDFENYFQKRDEKVSRKKDKKKKLKKKFLLLFFDKKKVFSFVKKRYGLALGSFFL